ncbi:MAG: MFS transporter [Firmicutes bacterium]|nr:MFS transporter [Bacillota bacterium]
MFNRKDLPLTQVLLIGALMLIEFSRGALIISLLPAFITGPLGASITIVGWAISSHYFLDTVFRGPFGWLVDRIGPLRVMTIGIAIEIISLVCIMHTTQPDLVIVYVGILGIGTATHWPAIMTATNRLTPANQRASVMGFVFAAWLVGSGVGPVLINFLLGGRDRAAFASLIAANIAAFLITLFVSDDRLEQPSPKSHVKVRWFPTLWKFRWVLPGMFVQNLTLGIMMPVIHQYTGKVLHFNYWQFAAFLLGSGALTVFLLVPIGKMTDKWGTKNPLILGFMLAAVSLTGIAFIHNFWLLIGVGGALGLSYALILPSWNTFLAGLIPADIEGWLWGMFMTVEGLGMSVGPIIGARLFSYRPGLPFLLSAGILLVMGIFYWTFPFSKYLPQAPR